ncbi:MAG: response regulator [Phenylobacterium sp.]|nr:response regulator [Phenylobacterium sp.]
MSIQSDDLKPSPPAPRSLGSTFMDRLGIRNPTPSIQLAFALVVAIAASPYLTLAGALVWFCWIVLLLVVDGVLSRTLTGRPRVVAKPVFEFLLVSSFCLLGLRLLIGFDGPAQTLGMATIAFMLALKLVVETLPPGRFWINVIPPTLSASAFELSKAIKNAQGGQTDLMVTNLGTLVLIILIVLIVRAAIIRRRTGWNRVNSEIRANALRAREAHKIALLAEQLAGTGHFRLSDNLATADFSDGMYAIHGFDHGVEKPGVQDLFNLYDESDREKLTRLIHETVRTCKPNRAEARFRRRDGRERIILCQTSPEVSPTGQVTAILGVSMDITEARLREEALMESEARIRMLTDHVTDMILWITEGGRILYASPSVQALGFEPEDLLGHRLSSFVEPADVGAAQQLLHQVFGDKAPDGEVTGEFRFRTRGAAGREVWMEGLASSVRDPKALTRSAVFNFRDVTRRRELEADLRLAKARAEAAAQAKSEFLANMSHEVRTPLTGVIGFSTLLSETPDLPAQAHHYIRKVIASGEALLTVVNDILDFSKLEAGQLELDPAPFPLRGFLEDVAGLFSAQVEARGLRLEIEVAEDAPQHLMADRARLQQVLANLLSNAIKFTEKGVIRIQARYDQVQQKLEVAVSDSGVGIHPDAAGRLFQRFTQADGSISRRYGGTGLGLSICRQLTELMGGGIEVISAPGAGSTFTFTILAPPADAAVDAAMNPEVSPTAVAMADEMSRILVVDDLEANRELLRALLLAAGQHGMEEAASGPEAIAMAMRQPYDIILMDLQMPGMDGFAAARAIRQLSKENAATPIIALSANVLAEHVDEAQQAGMNDHVGKPIVPARLFATLNRWSGVRLQTPADADPRGA